MTKEERYAIWNRYYQKHKTEINARRKIVRENYKNKLSKAENKIAELEAQIEKMKCCENCRYCNEWGEANSNSPNCKKCNWVSNWKLRR